jgi:hypothetical protein
MAMFIGCDACGRSLFINEVEHSVCMTCVRAGARRFSRLMALGSILRPPGPMHVRILPRLQPHLEGKV